MENQLSGIFELNNTKAKIFRIAARLFAEKGYNGVSMREISEQAKITKPTLYYYYGSKEGIYLALLNAGLTYGMGDIDEILGLNTSVKQKLVEIVKKRFHQSLVYPEFAKYFLYLFTSTEKTPFLENFKEETDKHRQLLVDLIQEGIDKKEFGASAKPQLAMEMIIGVITHFIWQQMLSEKKILSDQLAEQIIELLFKGLNE